MQMHSAAKKLEKGYIKEIVMGAWKHYFLPKMNKNYSKYSLKKICINIWNCFPLLTVKSKINGGHKV